MESMEQEEILILILITGVITGVIISKVLANFRWVLSGLILLTKGNHIQAFKAVHCIIQVMVLVETFMSCTIFGLCRSNEGGLAQRGITKKINFLESLRAPIQRKQMKQDDVFMKTNDSWKSKGSKDTTSYSFYQNNLDRKLS